MLAGRRRGNILWRLIFGARRRGKFARLAELRLFPLWLLRQCDVSRGRFCWRRQNIVGGIDCSDRGAVELVTLGFLLAVKLVLQLLLQLFVSYSV